MSAVNQYEGESPFLHSTALMGYSHQQMGTKNFCGKVCDESWKCKFCYYNPDNKDLTEEQKEELRAEGRKLGLS